MKMEMTRPATRIELAERVDELQEKLEKQDKDLEIWKKIAGKLADYIMDIYESRMNLEIITGLGGELTFKDVIDWARKEVENGK